MWTTWKGTWPRGSTQKRSHYFQALPLGSLMGRGHLWFALSQMLSTIYGVCSRCSKQETWKEGREGGKKGGRKQARGIFTGPRILEFSRTVCFSCLPDYPFVPAWEQQWQNHACQIPSAQGSLPLAGFKSEEVLWRPGHWTQGEERDLMPFSSEIAACCVPDDSSTTAGLPSDCSALPPLWSGN